MPFRKLPSMDRTGVDWMAQGWGKIVARRVHEQVGPELWPGGRSKTFWSGRLRFLGPSNSARPAGGSASCNANHGRSTSGGARWPTPNRNVTARPAAGIFFPQRPALRLSSHDYSSSVLGKIVRCAAREPSFREAAEAMAELAEVTVSSRQLGRIAREVGEQLQAERDEQVGRFQSGTLEPRVETRPALAVIEVDGGRLQIRGQGEDPGAHEAAWRRWPRPSPRAIPSRSCPAVSATAGSSRSLSGPWTGSSRWSRQAPRTQGLSHCQCGLPKDRPSRGRGRNCGCTLNVATTSPVKEFGPMVATEAHRRNFRDATGRAFLGDGSAWIWGLQRRHFPSFVPIVDFLHALGHIFTAARAETEPRWELFEGWAEACWKGHVDNIIAQLYIWCEIQVRLCGRELQELAEEDHRRAVARVLSYLEENRGRMHYPCYRQQGLPWTTSHVESTVKPFNRRVQGSEKFWSEDGAEAMLQVRAAFLSEDGRLDRHLKERPCSPFRKLQNQEDWRSSVRYQNHKPRLTPGLLLQPAVVAPRGDPQRRLHLFHRPAAPVLGRHNLLADRFFQEFSRPFNGRPKSM